MLCICEFVIYYLIITPVIPILLLILYNLFILKSMEKFKGNVGFVNLFQFSLFVYWATIGKKSQLYDRIHQLFNITFTELFFN